MGFTSVMYDGSVHPYEENLATTKRAVELAEKYGANVEAELGSHGQASKFGSGKPGEEDNQKILYRSGYGERICKADRY